MRKNILRIFILAVILLAAVPVWAAEQEIPAKDMVTMVDFGAHTCIPCKMMEPILEKLTPPVYGAGRHCFYRRVAGCRRGGSIRDQHHSHPGVFR